MRSEEITLAQLRALLAVKQEGSMTAAAVMLRVTQPVLTRCLQQLERQVGVTLLRRSSRGAVLNDYGEALVARARVVNEELKRAIDEIGQMQGRLSGSVTIACSHIPVKLFVPEAIGQLQQNFPDVEVHIIEAVYPEVMEGFRQGVLDFALGPVPGKGLGRDYKAALLLKADIAIVVRKGHPYAGAKSLSDLKDQRWMITGPVEGPGDIVKKLFAQHGIAPPATPVSLDTVWAALEVIKHSNLVGLIPRLMIESAKDEVMIVPVSEDIAPVRIEVITAKTAILTPAARALLSAVRASAMSWQNRPGESGSR